MIISLIFRAIFFYYIYKMVRSFINYISERSAPVKSSLKKTAAAESGPVIEAEYRVLSNKD
jgi:hypothetical protein